MTSSKALAIQARIHELNEEGLVAEAEEIMTAIQDLPDLRETAELVVQLAHKLLEIFNERN